MTTTITKDQEGRLHITTESGHYTVIPADSTRFEILAEAYTLYVESGSSDQWGAWLDQLV